jgi:chemotaxis protein CheD
VGALNCEVALEVLAEEGLTVSASDLGGKRGRRIHFHTGTGEVLLYRLIPSKEPAP